MWHLASLPSAGPSSSFARRPRPRLPRRGRWRCSEDTRIGAPVSDVMSLDVEEAGAIAERPPGSLAATARSPSSSIHSIRMSRRTAAGTVLVLRTVVRRRSRVVLVLHELDRRLGAAGVARRRRGVAGCQCSRCPDRCDCEHGCQQHEQQLRSLAGSFHVDHLLPFLAVKECGRTRAWRALRRAGAAARRLR